MNKQALAKALQLQGHKIMTIFQKQCIIMSYFVYVPLFLHFSNYVPTLAIAYSDNSLELILYPLPNKGKKRRILPDLI